MLKQITKKDIILIVVGCVATLIMTPVFNLIGDMLMSSTSWFGKVVFNQICQSASELKDESKGTSILIFGLLVFYGFVKA